MSNSETSSTQEDSFISHLVELRDRLLRSLIAVAVVLGILCLYPGPGEIYDILAAPLTNALPEGTKICDWCDHAFHGAAQGNGDGGVCSALPFILYQVWAFIAPGLYAHEKRLGIPVHHFQQSAVHDGDGFLLLLRFWTGIPLHRELCPQKYYARTRY